MFGKILSWFGKGSQSPAGEINTQDAVNSIRSAAIVALSVGVVSFLQSVAKLDLGPYGPLAVPVISGAVDYVRRWATDYAK